MLRVIPYPQHVGCWYTAKFLPVLSQIVSKSIWYTCVTLQKEHMLSEAFQFVFSYQGACPRKGLDQRSWIFPPSVEKFQTQWIDVRENSEETMAQKSPKIPKSRGFLYIVLEKSKDSNILSSGSAYIRRTCSFSCNLARLYGCWSPIHLVSHDVQTCIILHLCLCF